MLSDDAESAVEAFAERATDYVPKPPRPDRLHVALERARERIDARSSAGSEPGTLRRLLVRTDHQWNVIPIGQIDWITSAGNYAVLHCGGAKHVLRETLSSLENRLDPGAFVRVSRSALVKLDRIRSVATGEDGLAAVTLDDGTKLPLTRGVRDLQARLERG